MAAQPEGFIGLAEAIMGPEVTRNVMEGRRYAERVTEGVFNAVKSTGTAVFGEATLDPFDGTPLIVRPGLIRLIVTRAIH